MVTARRGVVKSTSTTTRYTAVTLVFDGPTTKTANALATVSAGPGSCPNVKSPYTDSSVSRDCKQYNTSTNRL